MATVFNINNQQIDGVQKAPSWIAKGLDKDAILYAEKFGEELAKNKLSTSQIRNVFSEVKSIQMKGKKDFNTMPLLLLKPKLAYSKARKSSGGKEAAQAAEDLEKVLVAGIDTILNDNKNPFERFENFANFFEAILAYHRSFGGK